MFQVFKSSEIVPNESMVDLNMSNCFHAEL